MTIITVASILLPKVGAKTGAIIDNMGRKWVVYADKIGQFSLFQSYEIVPKTISFNGRTFETIESATPIIGGHQRHPDATPNLVGSSGPSNDDQRRMDIFVCGAFNNMMANPNFNVGEINLQTAVELIELLKTTWKRTLGPKQSPISSGNQDMNDDIPF